ncbi:hypothetical protein [Desulfoplanes sp.]
MPLRFGCLESTSNIHFENFVFLGVLVWNNVLGSPGGSDGLVVGVFTNAAAFWMAGVIERSCCRGVQGVE